jgi:hypothetical protein
VNFEKAISVMTNDEFISAYGFMAEEMERRFPGSVSRVTKLLEDTMNPAVNEMCIAWAEATGRNTKEGSN